MPEVTPRVPGVEARAGKFPGPSLIPALHAIQEREGWLPREELVALSREVHRPLYEIEGLISFYPHFRTTPPRRVTLRVCHDLSCWLRGAEDRLAAIRERYGPDAEVEVIEGSCIGRCDAAPAATVNDAPVPLAGVDALVEAAQNGGVRPPATPAARGAGPTTRTRRRTSTTGCCATCCPAPWRRGAGHQGPVRQRAARHGRRRVPRRAQVGAGRGAGRDAEVRDLQRGRVRAGNVQGPADPGRPAAPGARGHAARHARHRGRGRLGVHPARVRPGGGGGPPGDRPAARGRAGRDRTCSAPAGGCRWRCSPRRAATSSARSRP